jgi:hypothetical protein
MRGFSIGALCDHLDEHAPAPTNPKRPRKRWSRNMIAYILHSETHVGRWHYNKSKWIKHSTTGKRKLVPRPRDEWIEVTVPAIVSNVQRAPLRAVTDSNVRCRSSKLTS